MDKVNPVIHEFATTAETAREHGSDGDVLLAGVVVDVTVAAAAAKEVVGTLTVFVLGSIFLTAISKSPLIIVVASAIHDPE